jgi:hypothetical protein
MLARRHTVVLATIAVVLGAGLVSVALASSGSRQLGDGSPVAQTALEPSRSIQGGGVAQHRGAHALGHGAAAKSTVSTRPVERYLTRAHGSVFDVRRLKSTVVKRERPEHESPFETESEPTSALPQTVAPKQMATTQAMSPLLDSSFAGLDFATWGAGHPPDTNGDVGPNYYIETVNTSIGIYDKSNGNRVAAFTFNAFMSQGHFGNLCDTDNFGDPVVLYDSFENRWFITDFAFRLDTNGNVSPQTVYQCFAVSKTGDPVAGGWNYYSILAPGGLDDYPKFGVWPDGIYMSANMFGYAAGASFLGPHVWALNKAEMYAGAPSVSVVDFAAPSADFTLLPANARLQTGSPPAGSPEYFVSTSQYLNALGIYKLHVDWSRISTSTFTGPQTQAAPTCWPNQTPANASTTANAADVLAIRAMAQAQYSNIGGSESVWIAHTVERGTAPAATCNAPTGGTATVRWYQANVTGGAVAASVIQGSTFDPEGANTFFRFMPALAVDRAGDMAIQYSKSNSTTNPQIKYAGRLATDPINTLGPELTLIDGTGSQSGNCGPSACIRWGDYSGAALDPNGCEFWFGNEYYATTGLNDQTRIGSSHFPGCTPVGNGTLSGTVTDGTNALAGATVALGSRTTTTDASGAYSFTVPAGTYPTLTASDPGFDPQAAASIVVPNGSGTTHDFTLSAAAQSGCFNDDSQNAFLAGVPNGCDLVGSPGNVMLARSLNTDAQNGNVASGVAFSNVTWAGQTFTPTVTGRLTRVDVELFCSSCTATTPNVVMSIRNTAGSVPTGADLAIATLPGFNDGGAGGLKTFTFNSPVTLTAGTRYAFIFRLASAFAGGTAAYTLSSANPYTNGQRVTSTNSGSSWTADASSRDLNFVTYIDAGFVGSGTFVSSLKDSNPDANHSATWTTLSFSASAPSGTSVQIQVAGSNSSYGPFNYVGPDGTANTSFTSGASLSQFNGLRYLRYKATLTTNNPSVTPSLFSVAVCFQNTLTTVPTTLDVAPATGTYGGVTSLSATLKAGGNGVAGEGVEFTLGGNDVGGATTDANGVAILSSVSLAGIDAGSYPIGVQASFAGDAGHAASAGSASLTVARADEAISITTHAPASASVGSHFTVAADGGGSGNPVTYSSSGSCTNSGDTFTMTGAGVCTVAYDQAGNTNYNDAPEVTESVNADKADQTITVTTHAPASAAYGTSFTVAADGGGSGKPVTFSSAGSCSNDGATFTMTSGTGTCTVQYDQAGNDSYNPAPDVTEIVDADKADQSISVTSDAPSSAVYGTSFAVAANAPGGVVAFSSSGACTNLDDTFTMSSGTSTCSVQYDQAGDDNYNAAPQVTQSVTAQKADQSISFSALSDRTYGDADFDPGATASSGNAVSYSTSGSCSIVGADVHLTGAGSCTVTAHQGGDANFNAAPTVDQSFSIATALLTITANDRSKLYGQTLSLGTTAFSTSGLVNGDGVATVTLSSAGADAGAAAGTYPIVPSDAVAAAGSDLSNYSISYANGTLTVHQAGVVGLQSLTIKSTGVVDSFDSSVGPYGGSNKGTAASVVSNGAVLLKSVAIGGDVRSTQSSAKLVKPASVTGDVTAGTTATITGHVGGTVHANTPTAPLSAAPPAACSPFTGETGLDGTYGYNTRKGNLTVAAGQTATLADGTYCLHNITIALGGSLVVSGPVTIQLTGTLADQGQIVNTTHVPANLSVQSSSTGTGSLNVTGGSDVYLTVLAPGLAVKVPSGSVFGSLLGRTLAVSGAASVHVDIH